MRNCRAFCPSAAPPSIQNPPIEPLQSVWADVPAIQSRLLKVARQVFGDEAIKQIYVSKVSYVGG